MFLRVSWGLAGASVLALLGGSIPVISGQQKVSMMGRLGPAGVWSMGAGACAKSDARTTRAEWRSCIVAGPEGGGQASLMTVLPAAQGLDVGLGMSAARKGPVQLILGGADGSCGWQVEVPVIQPAAQPWGLTCWGGCGIDFAGRVGRFQVQWKPGHFPEVWFSLRTSRGECTLGSGGLFWTGWARDADRFPLRVSMGVMRANLPWAGVGWGGTEGMGPDVGRWMALQWLRP